MKRDSFIAIVTEFGLSLGLVASTTAFGQEPVDEKAMFGGSAAPAAAPLPATKAPIGSDRDSQELSKSNVARDAFASGEAIENPLQIGGSFYQRMTLSPQQNVSIGNSSISLPLQVDAYLDARPSDRLRAYIGPRLAFDPTRDQYSNTTSGSSTLGNSQFTSGSTSSTTTTPNNPQVALDQAWIKFDIDRSVFVSLGRQHTKWGTGRYWNPTDFLSSQRRNPLLTTDLRLGNTMAKFQIPIESKSTNFYAVALFDNPQPTSTLGQLGSAFRMETLLGNTEIGLDAAYRSSIGPAYGFDLSSPLGPFDVTAEVALLGLAPSSTYILNMPFVAGFDLSQFYSASSPQGPFVQVSLGMNYSFAWKESRQATFGFEYFYNQLGYNDSSVYPLLIFLGQYQPFYLGKNYFALYLTAEGPDEGKHTNYTLSTLGNASDKSFITRLDFTWRVLTYLTVEMFGDVHYGGPSGEFTFALNTPLMTNSGAVIPAVSTQPTIFDLGWGLRLAL